MPVRRRRDPKQGRLKLTREWHLVLRPPDPNPVTKKPREPRKSRGPIDVQWIANALAFEAHYSDNALLRESVIVVTISSGMGVDLAIGSCGQVGRRILRLHYDYEDVRHIALEPMRLSARDHIRALVSEGHILRARMRAVRAGLADGHAHTGPR